MIGIISVKKKLYNNSISGELVALKDAAELCHQQGRRGPFTGIFAFSAENDDDKKLNGQIFDQVLKVHENGRFDSMTNEISVLGRTVVFKIRSDHSEADHARYVGVDCTKEKHIPLQRAVNSLLSVYYDATRGSNKERPGFVSFEKDTFKKSPRLGLVKYSSL